MRAWLAALPAAMAVLALAPGSFAQDCSEPLERPLGGHYVGSGAVAMSARGRIEAVAVQPIQFRAPYTLDFSIPNAPDAPAVNGTFSIQAPVKGTFISPHGTVHGARAEHENGPLEGLAAKGRRLRSGGFTLEVAAITCSQITLTMLTDSGTLAGLRAAYSGAGLSVSVESTASVVKRDGRDAALEAQVQSWVAEAAAEPPMGPGAHAKIALTMSRYRSIDPPGPPGTDPYKECLAKQVKFAAAELAGRRARAQLERLRQPSADLEARVRLLREVEADAKLASLLGCDVGNAENEIAQGWLQVIMRLAELGAPVERLGPLVAVIGPASGVDVGPLMTYLNGLAAAGGHAQPFP